jgi:hypothetical protein
MTQILDNATHIKGKALSGNPSSGQTWVFDGSQYTPAPAAAAEAFKFIKVGAMTLSPADFTDTLHISGVSGAKVSAASGSASGQSSLILEVSGLSSGQVPAWAAISGMGAYASGVVKAVSGRSGFVMASGDGFAVTLPSPVSGRILRASGANPFTDLYWGLDQTSSGGSGSGNAYASIFVQGTVTLDANAPNDALNMSGRSGALLQAVSGSGPGEDVIFFEVSGLESGQIPAWSEISGMASAASGKLDQVDGVSGLVMASGNGLVVLSGEPSSGYTLKWSGSDVINDAYWGPDAGAGLDRLENTVVMMAWDLYSDDRTFSDIATDDFENQSGVDLAQTLATYNPAGHYYSRTFGSSGNSGYADISGAGDVARKNLKASITQWVQDGAAESGHFVDSSGAAVTLGSGNQAPDVQAGVLVCFSGGSSATIARVSGNGGANGAVQLESGHSGEGVASIYGLKVDQASGELTVNRAYAPFAQSWSETLDSDGAGWEGYTLRQVLPASGVSSGGHRVKLTFRGHSSSSCRVDNASIVERSGSTAHGVATPTQVFFSGSSGVTISANSTVTSDSVDFFVDPEKDYLVIMDLGGSNGNIRSKAVGGVCYYKAAADSYNQQYLSGTTEQSQTRLCLKLEVSPLVAPSGPFAAHTVDAQLAAAGWAGVEKVVPSQTQPAGTKIYHAVSFDGRDTFKVYKSSAWADIVRLSGNQWQYNSDSSGAWQSGGSNDLLTVLASGFSVAGNQWTASQMSGMNSGDWSSTSGAGGFIPGTTTALDFAAALEASGSTEPKLDKYAVTYSRADHDISLVLQSWEASANDPQDAYVVMDVEPIDPITLDTDLKAWVSMNDGADYEQLSGLAVFREIGGHDYVRVDRSGLTPRSDKTMRLKITSHNSKDVRIHAAALGVKHS